MTPRQACVAFGLRNRRAGMTMGRRPDEALAELLRRATPDDCLDAAFALHDGGSGRLVEVAHGRCAAPRPFSDVDYYAGIARWLGCGFDRGDVLRRTVGDDPTVLLADDGVVLRACVGGTQRYSVVPSSGWLPKLASLLARRPDIAAQLVVVPPQALAAAVPLDGPRINIGRLEPLHGVPAHALAERVITRGQGAIGLVGLAAVATAAAHAPAIALNGGILTMTGVLLAYASTRALALAATDTPGALRPRLNSGALPDYSVLVPLYREDRGLAHLVQALRRLDYPHEKLDVQFLVEADDTLTQHAVLRETAGLNCRMTIVPGGRPRTKPRALNVGLRQARGEYVTIYDAEDRPDPLQLRIAAEVFAASPPDLAALQARLTIDHVSDNWLTRMFAIEYACLFDHVMPMVGAHGRLLLLGGTSNHFRTDALVRVGGWDPYNVTEDADLAIRMRRFGYRTAMIPSHTFEEAPVTIGAWLKQRSRWFKGFMQTWLVHNRAPRTLVREVGLADAVVLHLFLLGALAAALAHCAFVLQLALLASGQANLLFGPSAWVGGLQTLAVTLGYTASFALGAISIRHRRGIAISPWAVLWFPVYWLLMGAAVLIALHDLVRSPHHWRKTTHGVARRPRRPRFGRTRRA
ncbi:glycosyltransferase family 2 protein [Acuticoccus sp.]|uniref:glycosyltransferase family 2 protein n=1 Tax=Acuticoccus sp. TaxID=1904378 RepID=UPI003B52E490